MGTYILNTTSQKITEEIITYIKEVNLDLKISLNEHEETIIEATGQISTLTKGSEINPKIIAPFYFQYIKKQINPPLSIHWKIFDRGGQSKIELVALPVLSIRLGIFALFTLLSLWVTFLCSSKLIKAIEGKIQNTSGEGSLAILFLFFILIGHNQMTFIYKHIKKWEDSLWIRLVDKYGGNLVIDSDPTRDDPLILLFGIIVCTLFMIAILPLKPVLFMFAPQILTILLSSILFYSFRKTPLLQWKMSMVELSSKLLAMNNYVLITLLVIYLIRILFFTLDQSWKTRHFEHPLFTEGMTRLYYPPALTQDLNYIEKKITKLSHDLNTKHNDVLQKAKAAGVDTIKIESFIPIFRELIIFILILTLLFFPLDIISTFSKIINLAQSWEKSIAITKPFDFNLLPSRFTSILASTGIVVFYLIGSFINVLIFIITIDIITFVFTNTTLIIPVLSRILEIPLAFVWFLHLPPLNFTKSRIVALYWIPKMLIFFIISPQLIILTMYCLIFFKGIFHIFKKTKGKALPIPIQNFINALCEKYKIKKPNIFITEQGEFVVKTSISFLPWERDVLLIHPLALERLTERELKAIIVHEISHLIHDARAIKLSTWLSRLTFFPNVFLDLAFNWVAREIRADRFALNQTNDPEALISALKKLPQLTNEAILTKKLRRMRALSQKKSNRQPITGQISNTRLFIKLSPLNEGLNALYHYLFGQGVLGYLHPSTEERITHIRSNTVVLKNIV